MISHLRFNALALEIKDDEVSFLPGHVAVDAVIGDGVTLFAECG